MNEVVDDEIIRNRRCGALKKRTFIGALLKTNPLCKTLSKTCLIRTTDPCKTINHSTQPGPVIHKSQSQIVSWKIIGQILAVFDMKFCHFPIS